MIVVGVTGSIAAGKSTVTKALAAAGAATFDADAEVWRYYQGEGREALRALFPEAFAGGDVDRARLAALAGQDREALGRLEALVHPAVAAARLRFVAAARASGARLAVAEVPLLFETGGEAGFDLVLMVDAPRAVRLSRALERSGMSEAKFAALEARMTPAGEKRRRAHAVVDTDGPMESSRRQVRDFLRATAGMERESS